MSNTSEERESFPTFQSCWDRNGSARNLFDTMSHHGARDDESSSSNHSHSSHGSSKGAGKRSDYETKSPSRYSLFSSGISARNLWSVSSSELSSTVVEAWKCEECGHENYNDNEGECELCGTGICFMDERKNALTRSDRRVFVEEYGDDVSPIKSSPPPTPILAKKSTSLRELLSRHPSFQNRPRKHEGGDVLVSWGSTKTTPTANLSPVSLSPPTLSPKSHSPSSSLSPIGEKETKAEIRVIDSDFNKDDEEEAGASVLAAKRSDDMEKSPGSTTHYQVPVCVRLSPPLLLMLVALGIMLILWIPMHKRESVGTVDDTDDGFDDQLSDGFWALKGDEIFGDEPEYESGASVAFGRAGTVLAVGVGKFGPVRAWHHNRHTSSWDQMGQDLSFGDGPKHVALSRRQSETIAIASESDGSVGVFGFDDDRNLWEPLGEPLLFGVTNREDARASVSLSDTGRVLAVLIPAEGGYRSDLVRVLGFDSNSDGWQTVGEDIVLDDEARIQYGGSVSLSSNGMVLAVSTWSDGIEHATYSSHAEVYSFFNNTWQQLGQDKIGTRVSRVRSDVPVSLSSDGNVLAVSNGDDCHVFEYKEAKGKWSQLGQGLDGRTVSLSADAKVLAVGNPTYGENGSESGEASVYTYEETSRSWEQIGDSIPGEVQGDLFGTALSLSEDGVRIAVGAPGSGDQALHSGSVSVFELASDE